MNFTLKNQDATSARLVVSVQEADYAALVEKTLKNIKISKQKFASGKFSPQQFAQSQKDLARVLTNRTTTLNNHAIQQIYYGIYPNLITEIMGYPFQ